MCLHEGLFRGRDGGQVVVPPVQGLGHEVHVLGIVRVHAGHLLADGIQRRVLQAGPRTVSLVLHRADGLGPLGGVGVDHLPHVVGERGPDVQHVEVDVVLALVELLLRDAGVEDLEHVVDADLRELVAEVLGHEVVVVRRRARDQGQGEGLAVRQRALAVRALLVPQPIELLRGEDRIVPEHRAVLGRDRGDFPLVQGLPVRPGPHRHGRGIRHGIEPAQLLAVHEVLDRPAELAVAAREPWPC